MLDEKLIKILEKYLALRSDWRNGFMIDSSFEYMTRSVFNIVVVDLKKHMSPV